MSGTWRTYQTDCVGCSNHDGRGHNYNRQVCRGCRRNSAGWMRDRHNIRWPIRSTCGECRHATKPGSDGPCRGCSRYTTASDVDKWAVPRVLRVDVTVTSDSGASEHHHEVLGEWTWACSEPSPGVRHHRMEWDEEVPS